MARNHRGRRNEEKKVTKRTKWIESGGLERALDRVAQNTVTLDHPVYPGEFLYTKKCQKLVRSTIKKKYLSGIARPGDLPHIEALPTNTIHLFAPADGQAFTSPQAPSVYLLMRFDRVISLDNINKIAAAWDHFKGLQPEIKINHEDNRSSIPAFHLGVWEIAKFQPIITSDSRNQKSNNVIVAMDKLLDLFKASVIPKIKNFLIRYLPDQHKALEKAHFRVQAWLGNELKLRTALDFDGAFFTMAVKEGSSELIHIDWNDDEETMTWVVPIGDWEGGEFCAPQLGTKIPIKAGQVFAVRSRVLAHCSTPITEGRRIVFTCFAGSLLMKHTNFPPITTIGQ